MSEPWNCFQGSLLSFQYIHCWKTSLALHSHKNAIASNYIHPEVQHKRTTAIVRDSLVNRLTNIPIKVAIFGNDSIIAENR